MRADSTSFPRWEMKVLCSGELLVLPLSVRDQLVDGGTGIPFERSLRGR